MARHDGREWNEMRKLTIEKGFSPSAPSVIIREGNTVVHCTASVEKKVPSFVQDGHGWLTAEYAMLPAATSSRSRRDRGSRVSGRTTEIQRLIGRSLRACVDLSKLGSRAIYIDCDVLSADGGTRCASISGGYLALMLALRGLEKKGELKVDDVRIGEMAAISVGMHKGDVLLDLNYREDYAADVDMNLVMMGGGQIVEVQGTAEGASFTMDELSQLVKVGQEGIETILESGRKFLEEG